MVVSLLAVTNRAVKRALPEADPTQPAKLIPLLAAANNLSRCEGHFRAFPVIRPCACLEDVLSGFYTLAD